MADKKEQFFIGHFLRDAREKIGYIREQVAECADIGVRYLIAIELSNHILSLLTQLVKSIISIHLNAMEEREQHDLYRTLRLAQCSLALNLGGFRCSAKGIDPSLPFPSKENGSYSGPPPNSIDVPPAYRQELCRTSRQDINIGILSITKQGITGVGISITCYALLLFVVFVAQLTSFSSIIALRALDTHAVI